MPDPSIVQRVSAQAAASLNVSVTIATPVVGNWLVAFMKENGPNAVTTPAGWTHGDASPFASTTTRQILAMYKKVGGSEPTTITFSNGDTNNKLLTVWEVADLHATAPEDTARSGGTANTLAVTAKTLTTTGTLAQAACAVFAVADQSGDNGGTEAVDSGFTLRDAGTFTFWTVADKLTSATTALAPQFSWTTSRGSMGYMLVMLGHTAGAVTAPAGAVTAAATAPRVAGSGKATPPAGAATAAATPPVIKAATKHHPPAGAAVADTTPPTVEGDVGVVLSTSGADALPEIKVWDDQGGGDYALVGLVTGYADGFRWAPRFRDPSGGFDFTVPFTPANALLLLPDRLITIDWRDTRSTWVIEDYDPSHKAGAEGPTLHIGGPGALSKIGWELAWPDNGQDLDNQPAQPVLYTGPAETVIRTLILDNFVTRRGDTISLPASAGAGTTIKARARFDNLLELTAKKAARGGVGIDLGLVETTSSTRAELELRIWEPADRTYVRLSEAVGNLAGWSQQNHAPSATKYLVGGAGEGTARLFKEGTTPESVAAAATWGGHRVVFVNGPQSYDDPELTEAGEEALDTGASTTNVSLESGETRGTRAFRHYNVGDQVTGEIGGTEVVDIISGIEVTIGTGGFTIVPTFGAPEAEDPLVTYGDIIRAQDRRIRQLEQRS